MTAKVYIALNAAIFHSAAGPSQNCLDWTDEPPAL